MSESKAEIMKAIGNGANYVEFPCSREDVRGMLIVPKCAYDAAPILNYHPDYGFPNIYRVRIIESALLVGVAAAAITYNVGQSTIYRWLAHIKTTKARNTNTN